MKVTINGEIREVTARTVLEILKELDLPAARMVVERNTGIVQRDLYGETFLEEGDVLELVRIVGGG